MTSSNKIGYRGYIGSRPIRGETTPQHVQNLVIRDYAARMKLHFKLSATEYAMPHCYMMLESVLEELPSLEGIICFSFYMLPQKAERRMNFYSAIINSGSTLHTALEGLVLRSQGDILLLEDLFRVQQLSAHTQVSLPRAAPVPSHSPSI